MDRHGLAGTANRLEQARQYSRSHPPASKRLSPAVSGPDDEARFDPLEGPPLGDGAQDGARAMEPARAPTTSGQKKIARKIPGLNPHQRRRVEETWWGCIGNRWEDTNNVSCAVQYRQAPVSKIRVVLTTLVRTPLNSLAYLPPSSAGTVPCLPRAARVAMMMSWPRQTSLRRRNKRRGRRIGYDSRSCGRQS